MRRLSQVCVAGFLVLLVLSCSALDPWPTPKGAPEQATSEVKLEIGSYMVKQISEDNIYIKGELLNKGTVDAGIVRITVTLLDAQGQVMATRWTDTDYPLVKAGGKVPFSLPVLASVTNYKEIRFQVQGHPYIPNNVAYLDLATKSVSIQPPRYENDDYAVVGIVRNTGSKVAGKISVIAIVYGADGKVIDVQEAGLTTLAIPPGGESSFGIRLAQPKPIKEPVRWELFPLARVILVQASAEHTAENVYAW